MQKLKDSELRYRRLFEAAQDGILILDAKTGMIDDVNPYLIKMLGYSRTEFVKKKLWEVGAFKDIKASQDAFKALQVNEYIRYEDLPLKTKDGRLIQVEFVSNVYLVGDEKVIQCNIRDNAEHKRGEHDLGERMKELRAFYELARITEKEGITLDKLYQELADILPNSWQYPEITCARIVMGDNEFRTKNFAKSAWMQSAPIKVNGAVAGRLEVGYLKQQSNEDEGSFLKEERLLIDAIAERIGRITERKQAEDALRSAEAFLNSIIEQSPIAMWISDSQGTLVRLNQACRDLLHITDDEVVGKYNVLQDTVVAEQGHLPLVKQVFEQGATARFTIEYDSARLGNLELGEHAAVILDVTISPLLDADGHVVHAIIQELDMTERKQAEDALGKSEKRAQILLNALPDLMFHLDRNGVYLDYKAEKSDLYSESEDIIGKRNRDITPPGFADLIEHYINATLTTGEMQIFNYQLPIPDHGLRDYEARMVASGANEVTAIVRDITERKRAEEELVVANQELLFQDELLQQTGKLAKVGGWNLDLQTNALRWTLETYRIHEVDPATQVDVAKAINFYAPEARPVITAAIQAAIDLGTNWDLELPLITARGRRIWVRAIGESEFQDGKCVRLSGVFQDITEGKRSYNFLHALNQAALLMQLAVSQNELFTAVSGELDKVGLASAILILDESQTFLIPKYISYNPRAMQLAEKLTGVDRSTFYVPIASVDAFRIPMVERRAIFMESMIEVLQQVLPAPIRFLASQVVSLLKVPKTINLPLVVEDKVIGLFSVQAEDLNVSDIPTITAFANQVAAGWLRSKLYEEKEKRAAELVIANEELLHQNEEKEKRAVELNNLNAELRNLSSELFAAYDSTIEGWSRALDLRDKETEGHSLRVTEMTVNLARAFGLSEDELVQVRWGSLLHDIGKMGVPDQILFKPGALTDEEWVAMKRHPTFAYEMLTPISYLQMALDIPYCHHEKWDGSGYPRGLKGEEIPLVARIFTVVDVWDALRSDRPYRPAWAKEKVREHVKSLGGTHFDPKIVELFLKFDVETKEKSNNEQ